MAENGEQEENQYNLFGQFILSRLGDRGIATVAKAGGIDRFKLTRVMRTVPLTTLPDAAFFQGVAKGLPAPLALVHRFAIEAWGESTSTDLMAEYAELTALARQMSRGELLLLLDQARRMVQISTAANPAEHLQPRAEISHSE